MVFRVFGQVAMLTRFGNRPDDRGALFGFQLFQFGVQLGVACARQRNLVHGTGLLGSGIF